MAYEMKLGTIRQSKQPLCSERYRGLYNRCVKRVIGFVLAAILIVPLAPVFLIISLCIVIETGAPVFYHPERGGYRQKTFRIFKFRTMIKNADKIGGGTTALNDRRITRVGAFLRKTKLDEIAQLLNVLNGTMAFVGPRPELLKYTNKYTGEEELIFEVRPGITDYSSIEFISLDEIVGAEDADSIYEKQVLKRKNELRIKYAREVSFTTDLKIFFLTLQKTIEKIIKVLIKSGVSNGKNKIERI